VALIFSAVIERSLFTLHALWSHVHNQPQNKTHQKPHPKISRKRSLAFSPHHTYMDLFRKGESIGLSAKITQLDGQWVEKALEWSSQYGEGKGNWGACNVEGPPTVYPAFGDNVNAWASQTCNGKVGSWITSPF
jgi:hypothetical protein